MDEQHQELIRQDLRRGGAILSAGGSDWEMVKNPEPILYVLAKRAFDSSNDWIPGADLTEALVALRRKDAKNFNPHGWLGKEITDVLGGKPGSSAAIARWVPYIERSDKQPYNYKLRPELYQFVVLHDFGTSELQVPGEGVSQSRLESDSTHEVASTVGFIYETHLQEYMERSWPELSVKMGLNGFVMAERNCGPIGTADIVARSPASGEWVVIELKRTDVVDVAIGQIARYMTWVKEHRAADAAVRGILVGRRFDEKTRYSARAIPGLTLWKYSLSFNLEPDVRA
jgi:hypothetical protein